MADYLYNGVKAVDINTVWTDKKTYPYAVMICSDGENGAIDLWLLSSPGKFRKTSGAIPGKYLTSSGPGLKYSTVKEKLWDTYGKEWGFSMDYNFDTHVGPSLLSEPIHWTSHEILYEDDTLYLPASDDPIPVGSEHSKFDLYSWITGYFLSIYGGFKK